MVNEKKIITVIQARFTSARLPGKVLMDLYGKPVLERVVERIRLAGRAGEIWVATSDHGTDDPIEQTCDRLNVPVFRGSLDDVLGRFCGVVQQSRADIIVRVTADNPLTEPGFIDRGIEKMMADHDDYVYFENIPYGSGVEIVAKEALLTADKMASELHDREHVTSYIRRNSNLFQIGRLLPQNPLSRPDIRVTLDTMEDYRLLFNIFYYFKNTAISDLTLEKVIAYLDLG